MIFTNTYPLTQLHDRTLLLFFVISTCPYVLILSVWKYFVFNLTAIPLSKVNSKDYFYQLCNLKKAPEFMLQIKYKVAPKYALHIYHLTRSTEKLTTKKQKQSIA